MITIVYRGTPTLRPEVGPIQQGESTTKAKRQVILVGSEYGRKAEADVFWLGAQGCSTHKLVKHMCIPYASTVVGLTEPGAQLGWWLLGHVS